MAHATRGRDTELLVQAGLFVAVSTLLLTACFLGFVGLVTGGVVGVENRLPYYSLALALGFVGAVLGFEREFRTGERIIRAAGLAAASTFLLVGLAGEGVAFLVQRPDAVLSSQSLFYFLAAGLIGTGLGYIGMRHWEDLTGPSDGL